MLSNTCLHLGLDRNIVSNVYLFINSLANLAVVFAILGSDFFV
jgi:hypothetical protein